MTGYLPIVNPSPLILPNGSVILAFRYDAHSQNYSETNAIAYADSWRGPYRLVTDAATPGVNCEDPFIFQNRHGLHLVFHCYRGNITGCHSFSPDGVHWTVSNETTYDTTVTYHNGTTHNYQYRERPELLFRPDGSPYALMTGVEWGDKSNDPPNCDSYSIVTDIAE